MARQIASRIAVRGRLQAIDPLHVGSGREDSESDLALAVDGRGRLYAPGSSLTGPVRHWCREAFGCSPMETVFGYQDQDNPDDGQASFCFIEDALVTTSGRPVEVRDGVGIDRGLGTASANIKFDRAVLQPGTELDFGLVLDVDQRGTHGNKARAMLGHLLERLQGDRFRLGAAKTRGLGRVKLVLDVDGLIEHDQTRGGLIARLRGQAKPTTIADLKDADKSLSPTKQDVLRIKIAWKPILPTFVKAGIDGLRVDIVPLLGGGPLGFAPVIPGSSLKGILRAHAERILRTLLGIDVPARKGSGSQQFLDQLDDKQLPPVVTLLFGARKGRHRSGRLGALAIADCFAANPQPIQQWEDLYYKVAQEKDADEARVFPSALNAVGRPDWQKAFHVAIDRWTGGAADEMLYQVLEPHGESWPDPFEMELDLSRFVPEKTGQDDKDQRARAQAKIDQKAALALLLLTLRDLANDRIPIGFGGNRGLGAIAVSTITLEPAEGCPFDIQAPLKLDKGRLGGLGETLQNDLRTAWHSIIPK